MLCKKTLTFHPAGEGIPFIEAFVTTDDNIKIHTWLMLQSDSENVPTLIYFHGNAGNMGMRLKNAALMYSICGINVLMMDYRGYGSSDGRPSEKGLQLDALAVLKYAKSHPRSLIFNCFNSFLRRDQRATID